MKQLVRRTSLVVVLLLGSVTTIAAEFGCLPLRTFTLEERAQFETQYGPNWWRTMGLIPGPSTPGDYVERPFGDSSITIYSPQQFWDPRGRLPLRTFTLEERAQFETQYGPNWWRTMGLIPGPSTPGDWVEHPAGDSSITALSPQQFWDPRACASNATDPRGPKGK